MDDNAGQPRLLISSSRKPVSYINLAKRFLQEHGEVQLSALGVAISSMVTLAEILKNKQLAVETRVVTSLEEISSESRTRHKPKMSVTLKKSSQFDDIVAAEGARSGFGQGALGLGGEDNSGRSSHSGSGSIRHLRGGNASSNGPRSGGGGGLSYPPDPLQQQQLYQDRHQQAGMPPPYGAASSGGYQGMPYGVAPSGMGSPGMGPASMGYPGGTVPQLSQYLPGGGGSVGGMQQPLGLDMLGSGLQQPPGSWSMPMQQQAPGGHMSGGHHTPGIPAGPPPAQQQQQQQYALLMQQQLQLAQQQAHEAQQQQQQLAQQLASLQLAQQQAAQQQYLGSPHTQPPLQHEQQTHSPHQQRLQSPHPQSPYASEQQHSGSQDAFPDSH